jgi:hypothetical protein
MWSTLARNPQHALPRESLVARCQANHDGVVGHALEFGLIRFGVVQHDPDLLARRQLFEVVPVIL